MNSSFDAAFMVEEEALDPGEAAGIETNVTVITEPLNRIRAFSTYPQEKVVINAGLQHITPNEESLSSISVNIRCPQGCQRTFANSSALRLHLKQVHHKIFSETTSPQPGANVWYHCPVDSCLYHENFGTNGKHFPKLKYLKQHYLKVHAKRSYSCECGQAYSTSALLARHQRVCGLNLICVCGSSFSCFETLQTHARRMSHVIHPSTFQALRSRKLSLSEPSGIAHSTTSIQDVWTHHIPLRSKKLSLSKPSVIAHSATSSQDVWTHHIPLRRLEDGSNKDGVEASASSSNFRSVPQTICPAPTTICTTNSTIAQLTSLNVYHPIHLLAAVALGEVAVTAMKRMPCVDVGVQTECEVMKRSRRKSLSPGRWDPVGSHGNGVRNSKRKRTTETQTRLTHRGSKRRKNSCREEMSSGIAVGVGSSNDTMEENCNMVGEPSYLDVSTEECSNEENSVGSLTLQIDLPDLISTQSSSGTQTSPRGSGFTHAHLHNLAISFFDRACGDDEPTIIPPCVTHITSTQTPQHLDPFGSSKLLMEDDDLLDVVEQTSSFDNGRRPPSLAHIRSSSIETQTDHDVLLSGNTGAPEDVDEINLTNTETQTYPSSLLNLNGSNPYETSNPCHASGPCDGPCSVHGSDSLWCTSETQTYEDFNDIEQFMRSTIHTQTPDQSHSELFPELSFTHTQTQTSLDDPPAFVTTHTQTPMYTHFPTDMY